MLWSTTQLAVDPAGPSGRECHETQAPPHRPVAGGSAAIAGTTIDGALDDGTTYHQQSDTTASSVTTGSDVIVRLTGGGRPWDAPGSSAAPTGTASDITVVS
jgi:hypothetical protein